jgi:hypothetical protein
MIVTYKSQQFKSTPKVRPLSVRAPKLQSGAMPADSRAAAKVWNEALRDVIQANKRTPVARTVAHGCTEGLKRRVLAGNRKSYMAGTTGLESASHYFHLCRSIASY